MPSHFSWFLFNRRRHWIDVSITFSLYSRQNHAIQLLIIKFKIRHWLFSFSVIVAFATNYLLQQGIENATTTARYGVSDTQEFLRSTSLQSNHILVKNYDELTDHLELMLMGKRLAAIIFSFESIVIPILSASLCLSLSSVQILPK